MLVPVLNVISLPNHLDPDTGKIIRSLEKKIEDNKQTFFRRL